MVIKRVIQFFEFMIFNKQGALILNMASKTVYMQYALEKKLWHFKFQNFEKMRPITLRENSKN